MQESYGERLAIYTGPESYGVVRDVPRCGTRISNLIHVNTALRKNSKYILLDPTG